MINKLKIFINVIYKGLWKRHKELNLLKQEFLHCEQYMEVGNYVLAYTSANLILIKHTRIKLLPKSLQTTISEFWDNPKRKLGLASKLQENLFLIRQAFSMNSSSFVVSYMEDNVAQKANAQLALLRSNGKILLFDLDKKLVYTKFPVSNNVHYNSLIQSSRIWGYKIMKNEIEKYFKLPNDNGLVGLFHCQELVDGKAFSSLDNKERLQLVKNIFCSAISIATHSKLKSTVSGIDLIEEGFSLAQQNVKKTDMLKYIQSRRSQILELSKSWDIVPSHCDITAHNLTIFNNIPVFLDLAPDKVGFVPSFFIPLCLIHSEAKEYGRFDLVIAFMNGEFDNELSSMVDIKDNLDDQHLYFDLLLAETLILAAIDSKIAPQNIEYWFKPIFEIINQK
jgi:hypothetical protein